MKLTHSLSLVAALTASVAAWAYNVTGTITDRSGEPLIDATVRLLSAADSAFVKGAISDIDGNFRLTDVKKGSYILETSYIGYTTAYRDVAVQKRNAQLDTIRLDESSYLLSEATVVGVKTPIKVMEDTIEYNADTYKTPPNAVVEDLLKRLPGVEVDSEGKITANGKEVTKILVDGKEFFADDPKVASKNLPVNMVDKLQVVDRKSDLARLTGVDDGEDETVINLTVKPGMKNGWFGTVEGGYGTDSRYQATFNVNRFWNSNQITFIGSANNTNELGFTDGNGNRFRRFGGGEGINNSQQFGVNFNVGKEEIIRFGGDVMYSHTDRNTIKRQQRQYLNVDPNTLERSMSDANDLGHSIRADFRMEWKPDSFNTVDFRPSFSFNQNDSRSVSADTLMADQPGLPWINRSINNSDSHGKAYEASGRLIYNRNFASHRGRSFSIMADYRMSNTRERENTFSFNRFYQGIDLDDPSTDPVDSYEQYIDNHTWSNSFSTRMSWTEPLGNVKRGNFLTFAYRFQYRWNNADKDVDQRSPIFPDGNYDTPLELLTFADWQPNRELSNSFRNHFMNQDVRVGYKKVSADYTLDAGVSLVPSMSHSINLTNADKTIPKRWVWNFAPYMRFRYKFDKQSSLQLNYMGRSSQPSMAQLQPVEDKSNPLNIIQGNPLLKPTFSHNLRLRFQKFSPETQMSIMSMFDARVEQNSIISNTEYRPNGVRITRYENANGVWNARLMNMVSLPFGSQKTWSFNNNVFAFYNQQQGYNNNMRNRSSSLMVAESPSLAFRPQSLELELRPFYRLQATFNSLANIKTSVVHNFGGGFNATYYTPISVVLNSELNYTAARGYAAGYNNNEWMWNASISYQFLRNKAATLMLKVYDLLQQKQNIRRNITANYIDDIAYNSLTRYFMLTFTYKFNTFGRGNEPESRNMMGGWHGGPGGPGRPPRH